MGLSAVDHLLEGKGSDYTRMLTSGFTDDEISEAFDLGQKSGLYRGDGIGS